MKKRFALVPFSPGLLMAALPVRANELEARFQNTTETTKPYCDWYWVNGDTTADGITRDLKARAGAEIKRIMIGNIECSGPVNIYYSEWHALTRHAGRAGARLSARG